MENIKVLISHASAEKALAQAWKDLITTTSLGVIETWFSSDVAPGGGMRIGEEWRDHLYEKLAESDFIIAIQTPATTGRPWIMWECGAASGVNKVRGIIPIVFSLERDKLGNPLSSYEVYQGEDQEQVREVCSRLAGEAKIGSNPVLYDAGIKTYFDTIKLHRPREPIRPEQITIWRDRCEELIREGRTGEVPARRQAMYASLGKPFKPVDPSLHELLSRTLLDIGEYKAAIEEIDYALSLVGQDVVLLHRKALALVEMQNLQGAEELVSKLLAENDELRLNPELASLEGRIHRERWQVTADRAHLDKAFEAYLRAYQADRTQYYPGINAGGLALVQGDNAQAEEIFGEVLETCHDLRQRQVVSYWVDFSAGEAHLGLGNVQEAMENYRQGLSRTPTPPPRDRLSAAKGAQRMVRAKGLPDTVARDIKRLLDGTE